MADSSSDSDTGTDTLDSSESDEDGPGDSGGSLSAISDKHSPGQLADSSPGSGNSITEEARESHVSIDTPSRKVPLLHETGSGAGIIPAHTSTPSRKVTLLHVTDALESSESDGDGPEECGGSLSSISDKRSPCQLTDNSSGSDTIITEASVPSMSIDTPSRKVTLLQETVSGTRILPAHTSTPSRKVTLLHVTDALESSESGGDGPEECGGSLSSISDKRSPCQLTDNSSGSDTIITEASVPSMSIDTPSRKVTLLQETVSGAGIIPEHTSTPSRNVTLLHGTDGDESGESNEDGPEECDGSISAIDDQHSPLQLAVSPSGSDNGTTEEACTSHVSHVTPSRKDPLLHGTDADESGESNEDGPDERDGSLSAISDKHPPRKLSFSTSDSDTIITEALNGSWFTPMCTYGMDNNSIGNEEIVSVNKTSTPPRECDVNGLDIVAGPSGSQGQSRTERHMHDSVAGPSGIQGHSRRESHVSDSVAGRINDSSDGTLSTDDTSRVAKPMCINDINSEGTLSTDETYVPSDVPATDVSYDIMDNAYLLRDYKPPSSDETSDEGEDDIALHASMHKPNTELQQLRSANTDMGLGVKVPADDEIIGQLKLYFERHLTKSAGNVTVQIAVLQRYLAFVIRAQINKLGETWDNTYPNQMRPVQRSDLYQYQYVRPWFEARMACGVQPQSLRIARRALEQMMAWLKSAYVSESVGTQCSYQPFSARCELTLREVTSLNTDLVRRGKRIKSQKNYDKATAPVQAAITDKNAEAWNKCITFYEQTMDIMHSLVDSGDIANATKETVSDFNIAFAVIAVCKNFQRIGICENARLAEWYKIDVRPDGTAIMSIRDHKTADSGQTAQFALSVNDLAYFQAYVTHVRPELVKRGATQYAHDLKHNVKHFDGANKPTGISIPLHKHHEFFLLNTKGYRVTNISNMFCRKQGSMGIAVEHQMSSRGARTWMSSIIEKSDVTPDLRHRMHEYQAHSESTARKHYATNDREKVFQTYMEMTKLLPSRPQYTPRRGARGGTDVVSDDNGTGVVPEPCEAVTGQVVAIDRTATDQVDAIGIAHSDVRDGHVERDDLGKTLRVNDIVTELGCSDAKVTTSLVTETYPHLNAREVKSVLNRVYRIKVNTHIKDNAYKLVSRDGSIIRDPTDVEKRMGRGVTGNYIKQAIAQAEFHAANDMVQLSDNALLSHIRENRWPAVEKRAARDADNMVYGQGVFAAMHIPTRSVICDYTGQEFFTASAYEEHVKQNPESDVYTQIVGTNWSIDATKQLDCIGRFINHSGMHTNVRRVIKCLDKKRHLVFVATRDIHVHEQICYNYEPQLSGHAKQDRPDWFVRCIPGCRDCNRTPTQLVFDIDDTPVSGSGDDDDSFRIENPKKRVRSGKCHKHKPTQQGLNSSSEEECQVQTKRRRLRAKAKIIKPPSPQPGNQMLDPLAGGFMRESDSMSSPSTNVILESDDMSDPQVSGLLSGISMVSEQATPRGRIPSTEIEELVIQKPSDISGTVICKFDLNRLIAELRELESAQEDIINSISDDTPVGTDGLESPVFPRMPLLIIPYDNLSKLNKMNILRVQKKADDIPDSSARGAARTPMHTYDSKLAAVIRHARKKQPILIRKCRQLLNSSIDQFSANAKLRELALRMQLFEEHALMVTKACSYDEIMRIYASGALGDIQPTDPKSTPKLASPILRKLGIPSVGRGQLKLDFPSATVSVIHGTGVPTGKPVEVKKTVQGKICFPGASVTRVRGRRPKVDVATPRVRLKQRKLTCVDESEGSEIKLASSSND